ncbi:response regulator transcription factor [Robiginitalea sp. M366]|uniref:response regulator transcription factor n=1 Tax=Robiginitalea aestuariiviva TaxID=3036903 RepID=UPI00240D2071|nr:response regulator transcription factor [Robiginitalea aestuariiviva]MDG1570752.1 response regulator transcription factor [Robiginitalea aestuariiviva]
MEQTPYNILLVEDDTSLGYLLTEYLGMKGFRMRWAQRAEEVMPMLERRAFDLLILDVMMPETDGFTLGQQIHEKYPELPFIFLTARSMKIDVLKGFSVGAVDYLKKPIDEEELVVRIEALLARLEPRKPETADAPLVLGRFRFDPGKQELELEGDTRALTHREAELLAYLAQHPNRLCSHADILKKLWGRNDYFNRKSLNVFITRLRKHLTDDPDLKIENIHGQGFIFRMP